MPLELVLVRHGESEGNEAVRRARAGDESLLERLRQRHSSFWRLTDQGIAQARRSGEWLRDAFPEGFHRYYASEYVRAMETAAWLGLPEAEWMLHPDPAAKIANGGIVHYTRRDPQSGEVTEHLEWRRSVVPGDEGRSKPWERIRRPRYDAEGLLAAAEEVPRLV